MRISAAHAVEVVEGQRLQGMGRSKAAGSRCSLSVWSCMRGGAVRGRMPRVTLIPHNRGGVLAQLRASQSGSGRGGTRAVAAGPCSLAGDHLRQNAGKIWHVFRWRGTRKSFVSHGNFSLCGREPQFKAIARFAVIHGEQMFFCLCFYSFTLRRKVLFNSGAAYWLRSHTS